MKFLVVDDSRAMRMIVTRTLKQAGFNQPIIEAANGAEALELIRTENPSLVLSDWNMPEMSGIELLAAVRQDGNEVQFGFVTSESSAEMKQLALDTGASFIITKPFTPETFTFTLSPLLGKVVAKK